jgi:hypothetical protein
VIKFRKAEICRINTTLPFGDVLPLESLVDIPPSMAPTIDSFLANLDRSVMLQVQNIYQASSVMILTTHYTLNNTRFRTESGQARVAILFSGGIDSTVLSFLAHRLVYSCLKPRYLLSWLTGTFLWMNQSTF